MLIAKEQGPQRRIALLIEARVTQHRPFGRPRRRHLEQEPLFFLKIRRGRQPQPSARRVAQHRILAVILRKDSFHQAADKHHRQFPLPRFIHVHHMHHIATRIRHAQRLHRQRRLDPLPQRLQPDLPRRDKARHGFDDFSKPGDRPSRRAPAVNLLSIQSLARQRPRHQSAQRLQPSRPFHGLQLLAPPRSQPLETRQRLRAAS